MAGLPPRAVLDHLDSFIGLLACDGTLLDANAAALALIGVAREDVLGLAFWDTPWWTHNPDEQSRLRDSIGRAGQGEHVRFETTHPTLTEALRHVEFALHPVRDDHGTISHLIAEGKDITDRWEAERALSHSREQYKLLLDNIQLGITLVDKDFNILMVNRALETRLCRGSSLLIGRKCFREYHKRGTPCLTCPGAATMATGQATEMERGTILDNGRRVWIYSRAFPYFNQNGILDGFIEVVQDITEARLAAQRVDDSERKFRMLFDTMLDGFALYEMVYDHTGRPSDYRFLDVNPAFERITGLFRQDILGRTILEILPETERFWIDTFAHVVATGEAAHFAHAFAALHKHFEVSAFRSGPGRFASMFIDITGRIIAEQAQRESEARYCQLVQNSPVGILHFDRNLRVVYCNARFAELLRSTVDRLAGLDLNSIHDQAVLAVYRTALEGQEGTYEGLYHATFATTELWVSLKSSPLFDAKGGIVGGMAIFEDITERKLAEAQLRKLSQAVEQSPVTVIITNTEGVIEYVNHAFTLTTGYQPHEALGQNPRLLQSGEKSRDEYRELWETLTAGRTWRGQFHNRRKDGALYWEQAVIAPVRDGAGNITHYVGVKEDITERRQKDKELVKAIERLTETNIELERFAYVASHDLQEPLRTVTSFAQLLQRRYGSALGAEADEYIGFIVGAAKRMHALIHDLLTYSRVTAKGLAFTATPAMRACEVAMQNLHESIAETQAEIIVGALPVVVADEVQVMQLFQNLIGNAIKFHRPGIPPRVEIDARQESGRWIFSVADNGIGVEPTEQDIFEIFRRLHPAQTYPGTGIGLAVCKRIVQRHNGEIWLKSRPGKGTTFYFTLSPAEAAPDGARGRSPDF